MASSEDRIKRGQILIGPLFNKPMRVETVSANGPDNWVLGLVGTQSDRFRKVTLTIIDSIPTYQGDGGLLFLGLQAYSLGISYEFDPYFGLSISRVDPLPHQLEVVYDYLLKLARARFLLADGVGAGINLQCCHILFNYDIPWNPNRLEQRMGRIHRYGQPHDCLIFNWVTNWVIVRAGLRRMK